jgi:hypothetical protein
MVDFSEGTVTHKHDPKNNPFFRRPQTASKYSIVFTKVFLNSSAKFSVARQNHLDPCNAVPTELQAVRVFLEQTKAVRPKQE